MNTKVNVVLEEILRRLSSDKVDMKEMHDSDYGIDAPEVVSMSPEEILDDYIEDLVDMLIIDYEIDEDLAIDVVFDVIDDLIEEGFLSEMPEDEADPVAIEMWLNDAKTVGLSGHIVDAVEGAMEY